MKQSEIHIGDVLWALVDMAWTKVRVLQASPIVSRTTGRYRTRYEVAALLPEGGERVVRRLKAASSFHREMPRFDVRRSFFAARARKRA